MYDPTSGLQLRLMGVPEVSLNGVPLAFSRRRALALLVYLAVTGHVHTRDVLATLLSGEASESQARKRLSNALAELRQLAGDYVITTRDTASFNFDLPWWTDVRAFRTALSSGLQSEGIEQLQQAVDLFHEEFLSGLAVSEASGFDEWVMLQGEALRTQAVQALQAIVGRAIPLQANADGIAAARQLVSLEPWLEEAHRQLMTLLARVGQRQEAVAQYEMCRSILVEELGEEPSPETVALYNRLRTPYVAVPNKLPTPSSPLIGRETELRVLTHQLSDPDCRLVTLVGLGGSGKTRLALECARALAGGPTPAEQRFSDGVFFFPLEESEQALSTDDVSDVVRYLAGAISAAVGCGSDELSDPAENLRIMLASSTALLVLDGADRIPAAGLAAAIDVLVSCSQVTVLVTSREPLHRPHEHVMVVGSLTLPSTPEDVEEAPASHLLLLEARRARLGFALRDADRPHVLRLCHLVGGLPLALTLLAPWLPKLELASMVVELEGSLDLLTSTDEQAGQSHHSVQIMLDHAWEQLTEDDQRVLRRLSIFHGEFSGLAARDVVGCSTPCISKFMDVGIIEQRDHGQYALHELIRRKSCRELEARLQEKEEIRQQHAAHYARLVESMASQIRQGGEPIQELSRERDNIRGAWQWGIDQRAWWVLDRMTAGVVSYFSSSGLFREGATLLGNASSALRSALTKRDLPNEEVQVLLGHVLTGQAALLLRISQYDQAEQTLQEAAAIGLAVASLPLQAQVAYQQGLLCAFRSHYANGKTHVQRALCLARATRLWSLDADCRLVLSQLMLVEGQADGALEQVRQLIADCRAAGDTRREIAGLTQLGIMAVERGNCEQGRIALEHARRLLPETGGTSLIESALLSASGLLHTAMGCYAEAEQDHTRALQLNRASGWRDAVAIQPILGETGSLICLGRLARIQGDLAVARRYLSEALDLCQDVGSCLGEALTLVELSLLEHAEGKNAHACQLADQALRIIDRSEHRQLRRFALLALGHAEFDLGHLTEAAAAYAQALVHDREGGNRWRVIESTIDLARAALAKEDRIRASALLAPVLHDVLSSSPFTIDEPARAYLAAYQILHCIGDPRDKALLDSGHRLVYERTEGMPDDMRRLLFLQRVSPNRDLLHVGNGNGLQREVVTVAND